MKTLLSIVVLVALAMVSTACVNAPQSAPGGGSSAPVEQTPAQIAAQVCPPLQTALAGLDALLGLPSGARSDLAAITPLVDAVCGAGVIVNFTNLQTLQQTALPAILVAVKASGMSDEQQNAIILDLTAAQLVLTAISEIQTNLAPPAATPAFTSLPAPLPTAPIPATK